MANANNIWKPTKSHIRVPYLLSCLLPYQVTSEIQIAWSSESVLMHFL